MKNLAPLFLLLIAILLPGIAHGQGGTTHYKKLTLPSGKSTPYAVHLPDGFDASKTYPVLVGPGDAEKGKDPGYYWQTDPYSHGWIIVDAHLWRAGTAKSLATLLDKLLEDYNVEGGKFHTACWSANSAGIFKLTIANADRFHSITGMAGNPRSLSKKDITALNHVKVQFVVGENDSYWRKSAQSSYEKLKAGGIETTIEIVPNGEHVLTALIGAGFMKRLENAR